MSDDRVFDDGSDMMAFVLELGMKSVTASPPELVVLIQSHAAGIKDVELRAVTLMLELSLVANMWGRALVRSEGSREAAVAWLRRMRTVSDIEDLDDSGGVV